MPKITRAGGADEPDEVETVAVDTVDMEPVEIVAVELGDPEPVESPVDDNAEGDIEPDD
jgi:hypothetical protein